MTLALSSALFAQKSDKGRRRVYDPAPVYPQAVKNLHIEWQVRLRVTVLPNGMVSDVAVIGGNPILVESAIKAVKTWRYAPGLAQTQEDIVLNFLDH